MKARLVFGLAILLCSVRVYAQSDEWMTEERAREHYLCQWRLTNQIDESIAQPLQFCDTPDLQIGTALVEQDAWWSNILDGTRRVYSRQLKERFEADWSSSAERAAILAARTKAKSAAVRKREGTFNSHVSAMGTFELCAGFHNSHYESAKTELKRRNVFSDAEWGLINSKEIQIGVSDVALRCSWGDPEQINRTVTARTVHEQYVYDNGRYVYVENGRVTSIQDSR